jgi:hypothetical protein
MRSMVESLGDQLLALVVPKVTAHAATCNSYGCGWCIWGIRIQLRRLCCCTPGGGCSCSGCIPVRC